MQKNIKMLSVFRQCICKDGKTDETMKAIIEKNLEEKTKAVLVFNIVVLEFDFEIKEITICYYIVDEYYPDFKLSVEAMHSFLITADTVFWKTDFGKNKVLFCSDGCNEKDFVPTEHMIQIQCSGNVLVDVGWYGRFGFKIQAVKNYAFEKPLEKRFAKTKEEMLEALEQVLNKV